MTRSVVVVGARGRMGRFAIELLREDERFRVVAELDREDEEELASRLSACGAELALDFTVAGRGFDHGVLCLEAGIRPVIGTSGVSLEERRELDRIARERALGGLVVPNFSVGMWLFRKAAEQIAATVPDWHAELLELHHEKKKDAPSATALDVARRMEAARGGAGGEGIPIHSVRSPGLYAHHQAILGAPGETLTLRHDMNGPEAFGPGIRAALRHAAGCVGVGFGLEDALSFRWGAGAPA